MADYWKSQPRKFCQYCKCWIADNKPSVEFHERGKNHKENVAAKISEIKKKSIDKAKQEERMSKEFAAMEEAALKAYQEDLKRMERESSGSSSPPQTTTWPEPQAKPQGKHQAKNQAGPQPRPQAGPQAGPQARQQGRPHGIKQQKKDKAGRKFRNQTEAQVWVEGQADDGVMYYYNTVTGESQWEKPQVFQGERSASAQPGEAKSSSGCTWMEAVSPDGYTYYYNAESGESSWEKPAGFPLNEASGSGSGSGFNREGESQEEPSTPQLEPPSGGEEISGSAAASQEAEGPEQASQDSKVPKISFRKRKAEAEGEDKVSDDTPKEDAEETKKEEAVQSTSAEPEKKVEEPTQRKTQAKRPKGANPYGVWEQIEEEVDPYASVDLQLPQVEGSTAGAPADLPPEPKPKFKERIITSLGDEGGSASFRKNKTQNGKSRSLRQRDNDD